MPRLRTSLRRARARAGLVAVTASALGLVGAVVPAAPGRRAGGALPGVDRARHGDRRPAVTLTITGLAPGETVNATVSIDGTPGAGGTVGTADGSGTLVLPGRIADGTPVGTYLFTFTGATSGATCSASMVVLAGTTATTTCPPRARPPADERPGGRGRRGGTGVHRLSVSRRRGPGRWSPAARSGG